MVPEGPSRSGRRRLAAGRAPWHRGKTTSWTLSLELSLFGQAVELVARQIRFVSFCSSRRPIRECAGALCFVALERVQAKNYTLTSFLLLFCNELSEESRGFVHVQWERAARSLACGVGCPRFTSMEE